MGKTPPSSPKYSPFMQQVFCFPSLFIPFHMVQPNYLLGETDSHFHIPSNKYETLKKCCPAIDATHIVHT